MVVTRDLILAMNEMVSEKEGKCRSINGKPSPKRAKAYNSHSMAMLT
jgi:hypothetical protein